MHDDTEIRIPYQRYRDTDAPKLSKVRRYFAWRFSNLYFRFDKKRKCRKYMYILDFAIYLYFRKQINVLIQSNFAVKISDNI